eukprot:5011626-Pleurochrysis_carterae.AAC.1
MKSCVNHFKISAHHALPFIEIAGDCDLDHRAQPASELGRKGLSAFNLGASQHVDEAAVRRTA